MKPMTLKQCCALAMTAAMLAAAPVTSAIADSDKGKGKGKSASAGKDQAAAPRQGYFEERQRVVLRDYYGEQFRSGKCPPGLAKKNNGCMPPGQAKKWSVGRPLPKDVVFYPVPRELEIRIGVPPAGHRYVRVATDILLIAIGTSMVVDAIEDLTR